MSSPGWSDIKEDLQTSLKQRSTGLDSLEALLCRTSLGKTELTELVDLTRNLLTDANSKVAQQALESLAVVTSRADAPVNSYAILLVPSVAERLGDSRQPVRAQAFDVLVSYFQVLKPELVLDKVSPLWQHKNWKVKQGLLEVIAEVVSTTGASFLGGRDQNNAVLKQIVRMMEEPEMIVREAAIGCLGEIYQQAPAAVVSTINSSSLRPNQQREILTRLGVPSTSADAGPDAAGKRSNGGLSICSSDSGLVSNNSGGGYYVLPDLSVPVASGSGRASNSGTTGPPPTADPAYARPLEARRQSVGTPSTSQPPAASSAVAKRGGYKDGGGVTIDGDLPAAAPIPITSERELRAELEAATATLAKAPNTEWQERMDAMQRVEGLVLGGAVEWECFHEAMKGLAQALSQQFKERRSTIARQTCHLIGVLARAMGPRFEPHAVTLLPTLFGVLVITVAVMAESADMGVRGMLRHCQTGRLLQTISDGVCKEKNPKTRQYCATYLAQILEEWDVGIWSRYTEAIEAAIRAAAQDSSADTRQAGRTAMSRYHGAQPERAQAFLKRLDPGLQDKLSSGAHGAKAAKPASAAFSRQSVSAALAAKRMARQAPSSTDGTGGEGGIVVMVAGPSRGERRPDVAVQSADASAAAEAASARPRTAVRSAAPASSQPVPAPCSSNDASASGAPHGEAAPRPLTATLGRSRKSLGLPPGRIPGGSADLTAYLGEADATGSNSTCDVGAQARIAAARRPRLSAIPFDQRQRGASAGGPFSHAIRLAVEPVAATRVQTSDSPASQPPIVPASATYTNVRLAGTLHHSDSIGGSRAITDAGSSGPVAGSGLVPLSRVVATILGGPRTWSEKVEALAAVTAHVRASVAGPVCSPGRSISSDPGSSAAFMGSVQLVAEPEKVVAALERMRERLMEALDDPHQKVSAAALALVAEVVRLYGRVLEAHLDRLLPLLLNKGAENKEPSKTLCADVLHECGQAYRPDVLVPALTKCLDAVKLPRGKQTVLEFFRGHIGQWGAINATQLKHWLVRFAPLLDDRTPELRKRAAEVLDALLAAPWAREPINYVAYQHNSPDMGPLRRYLASHTAGPLGLSSTSSTSAESVVRPMQPQQSASIAVAGGPPATTTDSRRQLPSAVPTLPVPLLGNAPGSITPNPASSVSHRGQVPLSTDGMDRPGPSGTFDHQARSLSAAVGHSASLATPSASQSYTAHAGGRPLPGNGGFRGGGGHADGGGGYGHGYSNGLGGASAASSRVGGGAGPRALAIPSDLGSQLALLGQLLDDARAAVGTLGRSGAGPDQPATALDALVDAVELTNKEAWVRIFPALMVEVKAWVQHPVRPVRAMAMTLLMQLLQHHTGLFTDSNLESQVNLLLLGCGDDARDVCGTAGQALRLLLARCSDRNGMMVLQQLLPRERELHRRCQDNGSRLVVVMDGVRQLASRLDRQELQSLTFSPHPETGSTLLEALVANLSDADTSVRRGAVVTLADLWYRLGHGVRDVLQVLASGSYNLLCVYYLKHHGVSLPINQNNHTEHPLVKGSAAP